jgi:hypothetical protein
MPPTSLAVSTPTIVPAGARGPIAKLLIVIGMKLSTSPPADIEDQLGAISTLLIINISHI